MKFKLTVIAVTAASVFGCIPFAHASTVHPVPRQVTCTAFSAWVHHKTKPNLVTLVTDSFRLPDGKPGLVSDIGQLWADYAALGLGSPYLHSDVRFIQEDCQ